MKAACILTVVLLGSCGGVSQSSALARPTKTFPEAWPERGASPSEDKVEKTGPENGDEAAEDEPAPDDDPADES